MKIYCVIPNAPVELLPEFAGTYADAHALAKTFNKNIEVTVELRDYPLDKANIVKMLGYMVADDPLPTFSVLKTWELTSRGGLRETS